MHARESGDLDHLEIAESVDIEYRLGKTRSPERAADVVHVYEIRTDLRRAQTTAWPQRIPKKKGTGAKNSIDFREHCIESVTACKQTISHHDVYTRSREWQLLEGGLHMLHARPQPRNFLQQDAQRLPKTVIGNGRVSAWLAQRDDACSRKFLSKSLRTSCERTAEFDHQLGREGKVIEPIEELLLREFRHRCVARGVAHVTTPATA